MKPVLSKVKDDSKSIEEKQDEMSDKDLAKQDSKVKENNKFFRERQVKKSKDMDAIPESLSGS